MALDDALAYALLGWSIIPCHSISDPLTSACSCGRSECPNPGKHPRVGWTQYEHDRPTAAELTAWLRRWPQTNIGCVTGAVSELVVIDIDPRHDGDETLRDLIAKHGPLPDTVRALTGGGGEHIFFSHPGGDVRITAGAALALGPGIDVRADGGFVVLPPSLHSSGRRYLWDEGCDPREVNVAPLPDWLLKLLLAAPPRGANGTTGGKLDIEQYLSGDAIIPIRERNLTMTRLAGYHAGRGDSEAMVIQILTNIYLPRCEQAPDDAFGADEIARIVRSITRAEARRQEAMHAAANGGAESLGEDGLTEAARGLWAGLGVSPIARFVLLRSAPSGVKYSIELAESEIDLGDNLLDQQAIRKAILNSDLGVALARRKDEAWTPLAGKLRRTAIEVLNGPRRHVDQLTGWVLEWLADTKREWIEVEPGARRDFLAEGPCLIGGTPAIRALPFLAWLTRNRFDPSLTMPGLTALLRQGNWSPRQERIGSGKNAVLRFWEGPSSILPANTETS